MTAPKGAFATPEQVAEWLEITPAQLQYLRKTGQAPRSMKVGRAVRYLWKDVHAWASAKLEADR